jgi:hypothetical protein
MTREERRQQKAIQRDLVWCALRRLRDQPGGEDKFWTQRAIFESWLDGREMCGCAFYGDYIPKAHIIEHLWALWQEGRADFRREGKAARPHPKWRALGDVEVPEPVAEPVD